MDRLIRWDPQVPTGLELRAADDGGPGIIAGPLLVYGDVAQVYGMEESIEARAFGHLGEADIIARYMHDRRQPLARTTAAPGVGQLVLRDSPERLDVEIRLLDTQRGHDVAREVEAGVLQGLSPEFVPVRWRVQNRSRVVHTQGRLVGIGVVDIPAYPRSRAEVRHELLPRERRPWL